MLIAILVCLSLLAIWGLFYLFVTAPPKRVVQWIQLILALIIGLVGLILLWRGRLDFLFMLLALFFPWVQAYLNRRLAAKTQSQNQSSAAMSPAEALKILGLEAGADDAQIRAAHKRLMQAAHPDAGGSEWVAARLNQARDILLRKP